MPPRKYKKRRSYRPSLRLMKSPMPKSFLNKMRFQSGISLNPGIGTPAVVMISANGLYQPVVGAVTHQPRGFDQFVSLYDHYVVVGCKATVSFMPQQQTGTATLTPCIVGISLMDTNVAKTDYNEYLEHSYTKSSPYQPGDRTKTIINKTNPVKFLGFKDAADADSLRGNTTSNPDEGAFWHIFAEAVQGVDPALLYASVQLEYIVRWSEPAEVAQS